MPQLMSVPMAVGMTASPSVATTEPTGAMLPGWKSGVAQARHTAGSPAGVLTAAKASSWRTAFSSRGSEAGKRMEASASSSRTWYAPPWRSMRMRERRRTASGTVPGFR
jgi:hypothetical protein